MLRCVLPSRVLPAWATFCAELVAPTSPVVRHGPRSPACKTKTAATALQRQVDSLRRDVVSAVVWSVPRICIASRHATSQGTAEVQKPAGPGNDKLFAATAAHEPAAGPKQGQRARRRGAGAAASERYWLG